MWLIKIHQSDNMKHGNVCGADRISMRKCAENALQIGSSQTNRLANTLSRVESSPSQFKYENNVSIYNQTLVTRQKTQNIDENVKWPLNISWHSNKIWAWAFIDCYQLQQVRKTKFKNNSISSVFFLNIALAMLYIWVPIWKQNN